MTPTHVCPPSHRHEANLQCYVRHQCRCDACRENNRVYAARVRRLKAYGQFGGQNIPNGPTLTHLEFLRENGMGAVAVAAATGLSVCTIRNIQAPRHLMIRRSTAERVLKVQPDLSLLRQGAQISGRGVRRRIQALVASGWSFEALAVELGTFRQTIGRLTQAEQVTVRMHQCIASTYDRLWNATPPSAVPHLARRQQQLVKRHGWVPPLAWDDIDTDEKPTRAPDRLSPVSEVVDEVAVELACNGYDPGRKLHKGAELRRAVEELHSRRFADTLIAERLRINERTVSRIREELHLVGWDYADSHHIERTAA